jgi:hypothetical protein
MTKIYGLGWSRHVGDAIKRRTALPFPIWVIPFSLPNESLYKQSQ